MLDFLSVRDVNVKNKAVLVRVDYNVPMEDGKILNDLRIRESLPTLNYLRERGAKKIILISHLGRPNGKEESLSLKPVAENLQKLLPETEVKFVGNVSGPDVESAVNQLKDAAILVLENLRFYPGEENNSEEFIREIVNSVGAEIFVQDGFAVVHRVHASTSAIAKCLPVYAGLLLMKEVDGLSYVLDCPEHPLTIVVGGEKIEDKQPLIDTLGKSADSVLVGGKIAANGFSSKNPKIYVAEDFDENEEGEKLDCGPIATTKFYEKIMSSKTVVWNGLLGKAEDPAYATSSTIVAKVLGEHPEIYSVVCGGDTTGFIQNLKEEYPALTYSFISTGGGAALEFLAGKNLPGLDVLKRK